MSILFLKTYYFDAFLIEKYFKKILYAALLNTYLVVDF
jgi:hypothetical protein